MTRISKALLPGLFLLGAFLFATAPAMAGNHRHDGHHGGYHAGAAGKHQSWRRGTDHHKRHGHGPQSYAWRPYPRHPRYHGHDRRGHAGFYYRPYDRRPVYTAYAPWYLYPRPVVRVRPYVYIYGY